MGPDHHDWAEWAQRDHHWKWHIEAKLETLIHQGRQLMGLVEDLQAALTDVGTKVDALGPVVAGINTEVADLIARLGTGGNVTPEMVAKAQSIGTKMQALTDALKAIPPEPGPAVG